MKKCPNCDKTFEDSMKFCQIDGTPLVDDEAVSNRVSVDAQTHQTVGSMPLSAPEEVLDLPEADPLKTMYVSDSDMRDALDNVGRSGMDDTVGLPPIGETAARPEPKAPDFSMPAVPAPDLVSARPPSPYSEPFEGQSPIDGQEFGGAAAPMAEWTPPPAADSTWGNRGIDANTPFQPSILGVNGSDRTLAIASLILGIVSVPGLCCYFGPLTGIAALVTGYLAIRKQSENPSVYGGKTFAIVGMILGGLFLVLGVIYYAWLFLFGGMAMVMEMMQQQQAR